MIETVVTKVLSKMRGFGDKYPRVIESQNGVHPMDKTFILVGQISSYNLGTATKTLTTRKTYEVDVEVDGQTVKSVDGLWVMNQPKAYEVRISMQGLKALDLSDQSIEDKVEELKLRLDTPRIRQEFFDLGYTYKIDEATISLPVFLNTDQYEKFSFKITLKTNISIEFDNTVMGGAELIGEIESEDGVTKFTETVEVP